MIECPVCRGLGEIEGNDGLDRCLSWSGCARCKGTGINRPNIEGMQSDVERTGTCAAMYARELFAYIRALEDERNAARRER